jgi:hypothetical protein
VNTMIMQDRTLFTGRRTVSACRRHSHSLRFCDRYAASKRRVRLVKRRWSQADVIKCAHRQPTVALKALRERNVDETLIYAESTYDVIKEEEDAKHQSRRHCKTDADASLARER